MNIQTHSEHTPEKWAATVAVNVGGDGAVTLSTFFPVGCGDRTGDLFGAKPASATIWPQLSCIKEEFKKKQVSLLSLYCKRKNR